jgi:hypothetical protein
VLIIVVEKKRKKKMGPFAAQLVIALTLKILDQIQKAFIRQVQKTIKSYFFGLQRP